MLMTLTPSRKRIRPGDIFVYRFEREPYYRYGRVVYDDAAFSETLAGWLLVYLYTAVSREKGNIPELSRESLLLPPTMVATAPWRAGVFETVHREQLTPDIVFPTHAFRDMRGRYFDVSNQPLPERVEPCGQCALAGYEELGREILRAIARIKAGGKLFSFLRHSWDLIQAGDIFVYQRVNEPVFRYGRVIRHDASFSNEYEMDLLVLYFYAALSETKESVPALSLDGLLLPPLMTQRDGWRDGFFETIRHDALATEDVLTTHCFHDSRDPRIDKYWDEYGNALPTMIEPCGPWGLATCERIGQMLDSAIAARDAGAAGT